MYTKNTWVHYLPYEEVAREFGYYFQVYISRSYTLD